MKKSQTLKAWGGRGTQNHTHTQQRRHTEISNKFGITGLSQIFTDHVSFEALEVLIGSMDFILHMLGSQ